MRTLGKRVYRKVSRVQIPYPPPMLEYFKKLFEEKPILKRIIGIILVIIGLASILTPFTPVGFLLIVGLEMLGLRFLVWDKLREWLKRKKED